MQTISPGETKTPVAPSLPVTAHQTPAPGDLSTPVEPVSVVQVFSWVGGFALLLGIGFVIKYAIDNQLLSPQVRIVGSVIFGIVLWAVGVYLKEEKHQTTACTLCASGLSIAYVAFFAAHAYYAFVGFLVGVWYCFVEEIARNWDFCPSYWIYSAFFTAFRAAELFLFIVVYRIYRVSVHRGGLA